MTSSYIEMENLIDAAFRRFHFKRITNRKFNSGFALTYAALNNRSHSGLRIEVSYTGSNQQDLARISFEAPGAQWVTLYGESSRYGFSFDEPTIAAYIIIALRTGYVATLREQPINESGEPVGFTSLLRDYSLSTASEIEARRRLYHDVCVYNPTLATLVLDVPVDSERNEYP